MQRGRAIRTLERDAGAREKITSRAGPPSVRKQTAKPRSYQLS